MKKYEKPILVALHEVASDCGICNTGGQAVA